MCEDIRHFQTQLQALSFTTDELEQSEGREFEEEQQLEKERRFSKDEPTGNIKLFQRAAAELQQKSGNEKPSEKVPPPDAGLIRELENTGVVHVPLDEVTHAIGNTGSAGKQKLPSDPFNMVDHGDSSIQEAGKLQSTVLEQLNEIKK